MKERRTLVWSMAVMVIALVVCTVSALGLQPKGSALIPVHPG
ncbi:hypothetical protein DNTS_006096 [Danionella cerebrum]|uniref:Uncharacterized protein n=1 Tax=Danionella cerebrum TaxID=2873325 RepID=A0A553QMF4_9TELE|nr:hypothetical protein DNTS_006096 [Danionella translucida]